MTPDRPDPDVLLQRLQNEHRNGKLSIFLGAAPGVGKTYAMLQAAQVRRKKGEPVLVGYVETHGRAETDALLAGLEILPARIVEHRGIRLREFDLDAALALRPDTILVDELAHTNAPGCRHDKRWQDVEELLHHGIDVWTTVNIQHIESLGDAVARIAGTRVRELVPNSILERADAVQIVDLAPEELIERLKTGKVYVADTVEHALDNFFRLDRLSALRELALREAVQKVDAQMNERGPDSPEPEFGPAERILVSVGAGPYSARLVRSAKVMADRLNARWFAISVETPEHAALTEKDRERVSRNLHLARGLGAEVHVLTGERVSGTLLAFAREHHVTRIVIGKPLHPRWKDVLKGSLLDEVIRGSGDIDVLIITGEKVQEQPVSPAPKVRKLDWRSYVFSLGVTALATGLNLLLRSSLELSDFAMIFLSGVVFCSFRFGFRPAAFAAVLSTAAFDFFFVPPVLTFSVYNPMHALTFVVMLAVSFVVASLAERARIQTDSAQVREGQTWMLFSFTEKLASAKTMDELASVSTRHIEQNFKCRAVLLLPGGGGLEPSPPRTDIPVNTGSDVGVALWVKENGKRAGKDTGTLSGASGTYYPISTSARTVAVLGMWKNDAHAIADSDTERLLETHTHQLGLAIERFQLEEEARRRRLQAETEALRNALLSSVSHDLRTPLATIIGSATTQLALGDKLPDANRNELNQAIIDEAERMNRLVGNLLDMTRLEAGSLALRKEWLPVEEVIGSALRRMDKHLADHTVSVHLDDAPAFIWADSVLVEQLLVNLLDNAAKYAPKATTIFLSAALDGGEAVITVQDQGPGFSGEDTARLFDRFYRGSNAAGKPGSGLGLAICKGIAEAHGGSVHAENVDAGGARFVVRLPDAGVPETPDALPDLENDAVPAEGGPK